MLRLERDAQCVELELSIDLTSTSAERTGVRVHATEDGSFTYIAYDQQTKRVVIDRQTAYAGDRGYRAAPVSDAEVSTGRLDLRIFVDRGCVEVYVNGGKQVLSSYSYAGEGERAVELVSESGSTSYSSVRVHQLKSIGLE